jgi:tellurite resistance protein
MFGKLKELISNGTNRLSGKTDLLEGIAAGGILVSAADGEMDSEEVGVLLEAMLGHEVLSNAFSESVIQQTVDKMVKKASPNAAGKIGMVGKIALEREIKEVKAKSSSEDIELMLAVLVDVASADADGIEPAERAVINKISNTLGYGNFI